MGPVCVQRQEAGRQRAAAALAFKPAVQQVSQHVWTLDSTSSSFGVYVCSEARQGQGPQSPHPCLLVLQAAASLHTHTQSAEFQALKRCAAVLWASALLLLPPMIIEHAPTQHWQAGCCRSNWQLVLPAASHQVSLEPESLSAVSVSADAPVGWKGDLLAVAVTSDADLQTSGEHPLLPPSGQLPRLPPSSWSPDPTHITFSAVLWYLTQIFINTLCLITLPHTTTPSLHPPHPSLAHTYRRRQRCP